MLPVVQNFLKYPRESKESIYTALVGNQKGYLYQSTLDNLWKKSRKQCEILEFFFFFPNSHLQAN